MLLNCSNFHFLPLSLTTLHHNRRHFPFIYSCFQQKHGCVFVQNIRFFGKEAVFCIFTKKVVAILFCFVYNVFCSGVPDTQ